MFPQTIFFSIFFFNLSKIQILALEFGFYTNLMEFMGANSQENNGIWTWAYDFFHWIFLKPNQFRFWIKYNLNLSEDSFSTLEYALEL